MATTKRTNTKTNTKTTTKTTAKTNAEIKDVTVVEKDTTKAVEEVVKELNTCSLRGMLWHML